jgi:hypothetical protein
VPELFIGVYSVLTPMGVNKRNISKYLELPKKDTLIKCSDSGREPSRVPELGQKTFRLPPPKSLPGSHELFCGPSTAESQSNGVRQLPERPTRRQ